MARYQIPPDPRDPESQPRSDDARQPVPWRWLGMGVVIAIVGVVIALVIMNALLRRPPLVAEALPPTVIVLTAPPSPPPTETPAASPPTPIPTFTPIPTPDTAVAPPEITVGFYAEVANTSGFGVTVRGGPSTSNQPVVVATEGTVLLVIGGPQEANDFLWWQVELEDGTQGWAAGDFLIPAVAP